MLLDDFIQVLLRHAERQSSRPCLRFRREGTWRDWTYGQVVDRAKAIAGGLATLGLTTGDRLALMLPNGLDFPLTWLAAARAGRVR